jgi:hypothetical protein
MLIQLSTAAALLAIVVPIAAQENPAEPPKTGSVAGVVLDETSGAGVAKAVVILRQNQEGGIGTTTSSDGKFTLRDVDPGTYVLAVERDGYVLARGQFQTVNVQAGQTTSDVKLKLLRTGAISGRILDADGDPVSGVSVALSATRARKDNRSDGYATTNDRGEFRAFQISPGEYRVSATYRPRGQLEGVRMQRPAKADAPSGGEAYPTVYYPGTVDPRQAAAVKVDPGAELQGVDLQLVRAHSVRVRGHVTASGGSSATLLQLVTLAPIQRDPPTGQSHDFLIRDLKGEFEFQDVLPGTYRLQVQSGGFNEPNRTSAQRTLEVGDVDIEGIELTPGQPRSLSGRVIPPEGRKLPPGLMVVLGSREAGNTQGGGIAQVGVDGTFTIPRVAPDDYDVVIGSVAGGEDDAYIQSISDTDALAEGVNVGEGPLPPLDIVLKPNGGSAECTVKNEEGDPVPDASILIVPDPPRQRQAALFGECRTRTDGTCKVMGITPGEYHVYAFPEGMAIDRHDLEAFKPFEKDAEAVKFAEGERKLVSLKAAPAE